MSEWVEGTGRYIGTDGSTYAVTDSSDKAIRVFVNGGTVGTGSNTRRVVRRGENLVVTGSHMADDIEELVLTQNLHGWWGVGGKVFSAQEPKATEVRRKPERVVTEPKRPAPSPTEDEGAAERKREAEKAGIADELVRRFVPEFDILIGSRNAVLFAKGNDTFAASPTATKGVEKHLWSLLGVKNRLAIIAALRSKASGKVQTVAFHPNCLGGLVEGDGATWWRKTPQGSVDLCTNTEGFSINLLATSKKGNMTRLGVGPSEGAWESVIGFLTLGVAAYSPMAKEYSVVARCTRGRTVHIVAVIKRRIGVGIFGCQMSRSFGDRITLEPYPEPGRRHLIYDELTGQVFDLNTRT